MGGHNHPPRTKVSQDALKKATLVIQDKFFGNLHATPYRLQNVSIGCILSTLHLESVETMMMKEKDELCEPLMVILTPKSLI